MGQLREPEMGALFVGIISREELRVDEALEHLSREWGQIAVRAGPYAFSRFTDYYAREMGDPLFRWFASFQAGVYQDMLVSAKLLAVQIEREMSSMGLRRVNLDPGWIHPAKVVLSSTKDHAHRIYLGKGVYAEVTLTYAHGRWNPMPWTYPDYRTEEYHGSFAAMRQECLTRARSRPPGL